MQEKLGLETEELEEAFRVVETAWQNSSEEEVNVEIPEHLTHLTPFQWEQVCQILMSLEDQRDQSSIH